MVRSTILGAASSALMIFSAYAADIASDAGLKDGYIQRADWSGFYMGATAGYGWSGNNFLTNQAANLYSQTNLQATGALAAMQAGYNWQRGPFVFGLEGDLQGTDLSGTANSSIAASGQSPSLSIASEAKSVLDWSGTVRARAGASVFGRALVYGTAGFAFGQTAETITVSGYNAPNQATARILNREVSSGYTVGAGFEYALDYGWSFKTEYQYIDLGAVNLTQGFNVGNQAFLGTFQADRTYQTVRAGVNYHFSSPYEPLK